MHVDCLPPRKVRCSPGIYVEAPLHVTLLTDGRLSCLRFPAKSSLQSVAAIIASDHGFQGSSDIRIKVEVVSHTEARGNVRIIHRGLAKRLLHLLGPYKRQSPHKKHTPNSLEMKAWSHNCLSSKASAIPEYHNSLVSHGRTSTTSAADHGVTCSSLQFGCRGVKQSVGSSFESAQKRRSKACQSSLKQSNLSSVALDLIFQHLNGDARQGQSTFYQSAQLQCVGVKQNKPTAELQKAASGAPSDDLTRTIVSCDSYFDAWKPVSEISGASGFEQDGAARIGLDGSLQSPYEKITFP